LQPDKTWLAEFPALNLSNLKATIIGSLPEINNLFSKRSDNSSVHYLLTEDRHDIPRRVCATRFQAELEQGHNHGKNGLRDGPRRQAATI
jgi:hypothetical protein